MIKSVSPTIVGRVINMQKASSVDDLLKGKSSKPSEAGVGSGVIYQIKTTIQLISLQTIMLLMAQMKLESNYIIKNKLKRN